MAISTASGLKSSDGIALAKAEGVYDCDAKEAIAWYFDFLSNEKIAHKSRAIVARKELRLLDYDSQPVNQRCFVTLIKMPFPLRKREYSVKCFWRVKEDGSVLLCGTPIDDKVDYGGSVGKWSLKGRSSVLIIAKNIGENGGIKSCKVVYKLFADPKGHIPKSFTNRLIPSSLEIVVHGLKAFSQDEAVDDANVKSLADMMSNEKQTYSEDEKSFLKKSKVSRGGLKREQRRTAESHYNPKPALFASLTAGLVLLYPGEQQQESYPYQIPGCKV